MTLLPSEYLERAKVSQSFNRIAPTYEQWANLQKMVGDDLLERLSPLKINPQSILDVGAGTGRLSHILSHRYPQAHIYAIDIAIQMMQKARQHTSKEQRIKPDFICADAVQLPFANESIDLLLSNLMLQWCNDVQSIFTEFARVLKPEGVLFFSTFGPETLKELRQSWASVDDARHVNHFIDMHHYGDILVQVGLNHPVLDVDCLQLTYNDVKSLMHTLKAIGAHNITTGRPRTLMGKNKFKRMFIAYEQYRSPEGLLPATYEIIYGHAWGKRDIYSCSPSSATIAIPISQIK